MASISSHQTHAPCPYSKDGKSEFKFTTDLHYENVRKEFNDAYCLVAGEPLPDWLLVNKAILAQGLKQLHRHITVSCKRQKPNVVELLGKTATIPKPSPLIQVSAISKAYLTMKLKDDNSVEVGKAVFEMNESVSKYLPIFMRNFGASLKTIVITSIIFLHSLPAKKSCLSPFGDAPLEHLRTLVFRVDIVIYAPGVSTDTIRDITNVYMDSAIAFSKQVLGEKVNVVKLERLF